MSKLPPRPATGAQRKGLNKENLDEDENKDKRENQDEDERTLVVNRIIF